MSKKSASYSVKKGTNLQAKDHNQYSDYQKNSKSNALNSKNQSMKQHYWKPEHDQAIRDYIAESNPARKREILDKQLIKVIFEIAARSLTSLGLGVDADHIQDIVIKLINKALPRLTADKQKAANAYLWQAARNHIITYILKRPPEHIKPVQHQCIKLNSVPLINQCDCCCSFDEAEAEQEHAKNTVAIRKRVMADIDMKLACQSAMNTTNSVFLMLLKQHIIDHDYDISGFGDYIREAMHLSLPTYRAIAGRLGFRTRHFNESTKRKNRNQCI